jgi:hypothetical protein
MLKLPGKKIALVCSDPAGANVCMAILKDYRNSNLTLPLLFTNRTFLNSEENLFIVHDVPDFKNLDIDLVFTGTSHPASSGYFEIECLKKAKKQNIKTISFVDHWVNFKLRFTDLHKKAIYPDKIWVVDDTAKMLAMEDGLPEDLIEIHINPYHQYISETWTSQYDKKEYLRTIGIEEEGYHILFAPDPLSLRNGKQIAGFDEVEALHTLINVLEKIPGNFHLLIKAHPLQNVEILKQVLEDQKIFSSYLLSDVDTLELLNASNIVIGFYSNLLLEAEAMNKEVLRYFPGKESADLLKHKSSLRKLTTANQLFNELKDRIHG